MHNIPPDLVIRNAHNKDVDKMAHLASQLGYKASEVELADRIQTVSQDVEHILYVATVETEKIVGWVHAYICRLLLAAQYVEIGGLIVDEPYRQVGIGRELMACVEKWALNQVCETIRLRSNVIRESAHNFYESLGYTNQKTQHTFSKTLKHE